MTSSKKYVPAPGVASDAGQFRVEERFVDRILRLGSPDGGVFSAWMFGHMFVWVMLFTAVGWLDSLPLQILISVLLGNQLHAFTVLQHECGHGSAYRSARKNLWVGRMLAWFIFMPFTTFTELHKIHHRHLGDPEKDPDEWFYAGGAVWVYMREMLFLPKFVYLSLTTKVPPHARRQVLYELIFNVVSWAVLTVVMIISGNLTLLLLGFFVPMLILALIINPISRGYEHFPMSRLNPTDAERTNLMHNTVTVTGKAWGILWANINYHVEHHVYPRVPFYRLPELHDILKENKYRLSSFPLQSLEEKNHSLSKTAA